MLGWEFHSMTFFPLINLHQRFFHFKKLSILPQETGLNRMIKKMNLVYITEMRLVNLQLNCW